MTHPEFVGYEVFRKRVRLRGTLTLLSGLHIGCGRDIGTSATDLPVLKDVAGRPFIPGSSLKGVLRSNVEAFLRSFQSMTEEKLACAATADGGPSVGSSEKDLAREACISDADKKVMIRQSDVDVRIWEKSCWVCRTFGSKWVASKAQIVDLPVVSAWIPELLQVRDGVAIDRESETAADKMKYDFEVVPPGTKFGVEALLENPEDHELGMLVLGFDMLNEGFALLGGNRSRGLGRARLDINDIDVLTPAILLERLRRETTPAPSELPSQGVTIEEPPEECRSPDDRLQEDLRGCLEDRGPLKHDELVGALQELKWKREDLRERGCRNWADYFERVLKAGVIARMEDRRFCVPGFSPSAPAEPKREPPMTGDETGEGALSEEHEQIMNRWRNALHLKIKSAIGG